MARVPPRLWPELELYVRLSGHFENLFCKTRRLFCKTFRSREQKDYKKQRRGRGGTGRRKGLKIPRWQRRVGSSPTARTNRPAHPVSQVPVVQGPTPPWSGDIILSPNYGALCFDRNNPETIHVYRDEPVSGCERFGSGLRERLGVPRQSSRQGAGLYRVSSAQGSRGRGSHALCLAHDLGKPRGV